MNNNSKITDLRKEDNTSRVVTLVLGWISGIAGMLLIVKAYFASKAGRSIDVQVPNLGSLSPFQAAVMGVLGITIGVIVVWDLRRNKGRPSI